MRVAKEGPKRYFGIGQVFADAVNSTGRKSDGESLVRQALRESIRHHLVADVPVGMFLSAGIDEAPWRVSRRKS